MNRITLIYLTAAVLAVVFFALAGFVMDGYQDCAAMGGLSFCVPGSLPANCAERETLLFRDFLEYCGGGCFLFSIFFPVLIAYREKQALEDERSQLFLRQI